MDVGIWIRVSTDDQAKGESPKHHEIRARSYAQDRGWSVVEFYDLSGVSGKTVLDHPEAKRMYADIATGKIKALLFSKLARLARNTRELLDISDYFKKHNADLVSLSEYIDTSTAAGKLFYTMLAAFAEWEREEIASRVAASVPIRAKLGKIVAGKPSLGYTWDKETKKLLIDEAEAPAVKRMFEIFRETNKLRTTASMLNKEGYRARKGLFSDTTTRRLLENPIYKGLRRANYTKSKGNKKAWELKPQDVWVIVESPAIVSTELWDSCNAILSKPKREPIPKEGRNLFSGVLICECGVKMYHVPWKGMKTKTYRCEACKAKITEPLLIEQFIDTMKSLTINREQIEPAQKPMANIEELKNRHNMFKREMAGIETKIDKLIEIYSDQMIDKETFNKRFVPLAERKEQIKVEIPRIEGQIAVIETADIGRDYMVTEVVTLLSMWDLFTEEERRKVVKSLVSKIIVSKDEIEFVLNYLPGLSSPINDQRTPRGSLQ